jgi:cytochrome c-type biogenesis protein CcmH/NrfG
MNMNRIPTKQWTVKQALILAVVCLCAGMAGGWSIRSTQKFPLTPAVTASGHIASASAPPPAAATTTPPSPNPVQMRAMADAQAAPLIENLKAEPNNAGLLVSIGNVYYDAHQYPIAVDYYARALKLRPSDAAVRTDMATAHWFMGDADLAIAEFTRALTYAPDNPNTLFNRGLVRWQGKKDSAGAIADWEKLLVVAPHYEGKDKVKQMLADVKNHAPSVSGMASK